VKVIIIGAKGTLGVALAGAFAETHPILWDIEDLDITDEKETIKKISDACPDVVINAAGYTDVDGAEKNEELAMNINGHAAGTIARAAKLVGAVMVHFGTDYIFDGTKKEGYAETDKPDPASVYGRSKLLGENEALKENDKTYIIRLSRLFGSAQRGGRSKKSFVDLMLALAEKNKKLDVVDEEVSSPTYAPDVAWVTKEIVVNKIPFGVYHCSNSGFCTWYEFAEEIFLIKGIAVELNRVSGDHFKRSAKRPAYSVLLSTKLSPMRPWQDALKEYLSCK
jgi:dTDP-4-dehydrorhamnose reductase